MRIYNGTKFTLTLPYAGGENLTIAPKTPSGNVLCTNDFISMIITSYTTEEVAIIAAGPFEVTACANVPTATNYVVQSLEEAIARFNPSAALNKKPEVKKPEPEVKEEAAPTPIPEAKPEPKPEVKPEVKPVVAEPKKEEKKEEAQPMTPVMTPVVKKEEKKAKKEELKKEEPKKEEEQK